jgi:hypothetical protein
MSGPVFVVSAGGTVSLVDIPTNVHARERFDQAIAKGELCIVDAAEVVEEGTPETGIKYRLAATPTERKPRPVVAPEGTASDAPASDSPPPPAGDGAPAGDPPAGDPPTKPKKTAGVEAWRAYAIAQGMDPEAAATAEKAALVEQYGG